MAEPLVAEHLDFFPMISFKYFGANPYLGLMILTYSSVISSPSLISLMKYNKRPNFIFTCSLNFQP